MKRKVVKSRRQGRATKSGDGSNSQYARKVALQKKGTFSPNSPFSVAESGGVSLEAFHKMRFKHSRDQKSA